MDNNNGSEKSALNEKLNAKKKKQNTQPSYRRDLRSEFFNSDEMIIKLTPQPTNLIK